MSKKKIIFTIISILIIVIAGIVGYIIEQKPIIQSKPIQVNKTLVDALEVKIDNYYPHVSALGKVEASNQINLTSEVSGKIIKINKNFVPGGFLKKGEVILEIDPSNYKLAYDQAVADYKTAKADYQKAIGQQNQAKRELKIYERNTGERIKNSYLALRKPDLEIALANLQKVKAAMDQAKINLDNTKLKAPFNCIVYSRNISYGGYVSPQATIANLVNTSSYWVEASIPVEYINMIDLTNTNNKAILTMSNNRGTISASIFKILDYLGTGARFVNLLLIVPDPLSLNKNNKSPKLLLDDYVTVDITGKLLKNVLRIPLYTLKNNNMVWLYDNGKLKISKVNVEFQDKDYAYVTGLKNGDLIITSDIGIVVPGMLLELSKNTM